VPVIGAAVVLFAAAIVASLVPATRASRVDVLQALRSE
jgi:ABC-type lipoprotein release transport system permease subunit